MFSTLVIMSNWETWALVLHSSYSAPRKLDMKKVTRESKLSTRLILHKWSHSLLFRTDQHCWKKFFAGILFCLSYRDTTTECFFRDAFANTTLCSNQQMVIKSRLDACPWRIKHNATGAWSVCQMKLQFTSSALNVGLLSYFQFIEVHGSLICLACLDIELLWEAGVGGAECQILLSLLSKDVLCYKCKVCPPWRMLQFNIKPDVCILTIQSRKICENGK